MAANISLEEHIRKEAARFGVPYRLVRQVIQQESKGVNGLTSSEGAQGVMQLMPGTAKEMGVVDVWDPYQNITGGIKYLAKAYRAMGNEADAAGAYFAGIGGMRVYIAEGRPRSKNPLTQKYISEVTSIQVPDTPFELNKPVDYPKGAKGQQNSEGVPTYLNPTSPAVEEALSRLQFLGEQPLTEIGPKPIPYKVVAEEIIPSNTLPIDLPPMTGGYTEIRNPTLDEALQWIKSNEYVR